MLVVAVVLKEGEGRGRRYRGWGATGGIEEVALKEVVASEAVVTLKGASGVTGMVGVGARDRGGLWGEGGEMEAVS